MMLMKTPEETELFPTEVCEKVRPEVWADSTVWVLGLSVVSESLRPF